jgi:acyl dehydratase
MVITYPQVVVAALHMHLMTQPNFPLPLVGIVHLANTFTQHAPLTVGVPYDVQARIATSRRSKLGIEVDLVTEFRGGEALLWTSTMTVLHRIKAKSKSRSAPPPPAPVAAAEYQPFTVPEDTGRRYAPVARDYNPIHLYPFTARLLGFDRAIAHGMWSVARCLGLMLPAYAAAQGGLPSRLTIQFKQPLLLPGRVTLKQVAGEAGMEFDLLAREGGRTHLSGRLEGVLAATGM